MKTKEIEQIEENKVFSFLDCDLKVIVSSTGWISIEQLSNSACDDAFISVGGITGKRARLIKEAFEYAEELNLIKQRN